MRGGSDPKRDGPAVDIGTLRDTLAYIRDDLGRTPGLEQAAELVGAAVAEVEVAERRRLAPIPRSVMEARLLARRRH
jgi:hypothetical protein